MTKPNEMSPDKLDALMDRARTLRSETLKDMVKCLFYREDSSASASGVIDPRKAVGEAA